MSLTAIPKDITLEQLDAWGPVADLGSEILEGNPQAYGRMTHGTPDAPVSAAFFGSTKGKFRMVYPFNEQATIMLGEVRLTDESSGKTTTFGTGDTWFVTKGTPVLWEVLSDSFIKHYHAVA